jgi:hypothetical protein
MEPANAHRLKTGNQPIEQLLMFSKLLLSKFEENLRLFRIGELAFDSCHEAHRSIKPSVSFRSSRQVQLNREHSDLRVAEAPDDASDGGLGSSR